MTHAAHIPAGVQSRAPHPVSLITLNLVLLHRFSLLVLVFPYCVWSKQTANASTPHVVVDLWAAIIDNCKNLTVAKPFLCKLKLSQTSLAKYSLNHKATNPSQNKILNVEC